MSQARAQHLQYQLQDDRTWSCGLDDELLMIQTDKDLRDDFNPFSSCKCQAHPCIRKQLVEQVLCSPPRLCLFYQRAVHEEVELFKKFISMFAF